MVYELFTSAFFPHAIELTRIRQHNIDILFPRKIIIELICLKKNDVDSTIKYDVYVNILGK